MTAEQLQQKIEARERLVLIDVRSRWEYSAGHIETAHNIPYWKIFRAKQLLRLTPGAEVVLYCEHGPRAWMSGILLRLVGVAPVSYLAGHMLGWKKAGRPLRKS